jgi:signal transduction histidine kinase
VSLPLYHSLAGQAILQHGPITCEDVRSDPRFCRPDLARDYGWTRAMVVPLVVGDKNDPMGAFSVYSTETEPGRFAESEWDKKVLTCLAHYAALAVQNSARLDELRAAQEQNAVAETFAAIGDIAANLLHNLNNKVGTIPVRIQGIQDKCRPALLANPYLAANLAEIECSASEAMEAVRENLSRLHPIHIVPVNVDRCVDEAVKSANLLPGIIVRRKNLKSLPVVMAGERSLVLVFTNLLENASNAMGGRGTVTVSGSFQDGWVEISVRDTGPGIPPELQDRIFELNYTGITSSPAAKLGFGLWWVKTVMTRLGGSASVESDGFHGTVFHLKLPRVQMTEASR